LNEGENCITPNQLQLLSTKTEVFDANKQHPTSLPRNVAPELKVQHLAHSPTACWAAGSSTCQFTAPLL